MGPTASNEKHDITSNGISTNAGRRQRVRRPFTVTESAAIWNYIVFNGLRTQVHRRSIWHAMEAASITSHSAESMRSHFRQVLCAQVPSGSMTSFSHRPTRSRRHVYTTQDDQAIVDYILHNKCFSEVRSRNFWHRLERERLTTHSAESMRSRFRHHLLPRILEELRRVLTVTEYEYALHSIIPPKSRTLSICTESELNTTGDFLISETTSECSPSIISPSLLHRGSSYRNTSREISVMHSTPCKVQTHDSLRSNENFALDSSHRSAHSSRLVKSFDSKTTSTSTVTNHVPQSFGKVPDFARKLMQSSDLVTNPLQAYVLLRMTNGSIVEAQNFLRTGRRRPDVSPRCDPPLWRLEDDEQLGSCDEKVLRKLLQRFGADEVIHRIAFLADG